MADLYPDDSLHEGHVRGCQIRKDLVPFLENAFNGLQDRYNSEPEIAKFIGRVWALSWKKRLLETFNRLEEREADRAARLVDHYFNNYIAVPPSEPVTLRMLDDPDGVMNRLEGEIEGLRKEVNE